VSTTDLDHQGADPAGPADSRHGVDDSAIAVLPWWRSPVNLASIAIALVILAAGFGYVVGNNRAIDDPNAVDVGYLQDMRFHHEQAVQMSLIYLDKAQQDTDLALMAVDTVISQNIEIGRMIQLLREFGQPEINETDLAMAWMNEPLPLERMPGLATDDDIIALLEADGARAHEIFVRLMTAHHQGGIHMSDHAAEHASTAEVRLMASKIAAGQRDELAEMSRMTPDQ
jgi:uncharacterized protein (DUF305 family)